MKYELPQNHGLSDAIVDHLVFNEGLNPALTDVQFEALQAGVGRGDSALILSPTSTGKTQIAVWAIARSIENRTSTVYLVTHRALAKQKFDDFKSLLLTKFLGNAGTSLVSATGDYVEDADGNIPAEPLRTPLLVATYEKYLALLSASGIPADMGASVIVCDEIQLIGDEHRGQNVELLLTLVRNAGWRQFVGLSAVLDPRDAKELADWLGVALVVQHTREKHLRYECWTLDGIASVTTEFPDTIEEGAALPKGVELDPVSILADLLRQKSPPLPVIVFCTRKKQDTYDLARRFLAERAKGAKGQLSLAFEGLPETSANAFLAGSIGQRIAVHSADLMDEERRIVEQHLLEGKLDIVFATSTLAAGVNFPLGAAVFASWDRWDFDRRKAVPIQTAEFHNMAGRVGRMGFQHEQGRIIFIAKNKTDFHTAKQYLDLDAMPSIQPRIAPERFNQLVLQLVASGLCGSKADVEKLVCTSFSALREQEKRNANFLKWPQLLSDAIKGLLAESLLIQSSAGRLTATPVGKAVGHSGLLPETGTYLLDYAINKIAKLVQYLPSSAKAGDMLRLAFLLFCACFSAPEFRTTNGKKPTRLLPWPLDTGYLFDANAYKDDLPEPIWNADLAPVNAAKLALDWIGGEEIGTLEKSLDHLSAGMLREMFRHLAWALQGFAAIVAAAADPRTPPASRPEALRAGDGLDLLRKLPRITRRFGFRVSEGLPDDVLWMSGLNTSDSEFRISRNEILALRGLGYSTPELVMLGSNEAAQAREAIFSKAKPTPQAKAIWLRDTCRTWKVNQRKRAAERHLKRARRCPNIGHIEAYYRSKGTGFEKALEEIFGLLNIHFEKLDDRSKTGAPDYLVSFEDSPPIIIELKSREGDNLVDYNKAVEVLAASEVHGYKNAFCVTLCHPGVDPSVPAVISSCGRLSVVESHDLGEALLRLCEGTLSQKQLWQWLASPGQALISDLPFPDYQ